MRLLNDPLRPGAKGMRLTDTSVNTAQERVTVDDRVTFNQGMMGGSSGIGRVMSPLTLNRPDLGTPLIDAKQGEFEATNPYFNPKSKQIFAALNYGRRPLGASTFYGYSHMVLNRKFKTNAIYFAGDTFGENVRYEKISINDQVSYNTLGAIYGKANVALRKEIEKSCFPAGSELPDTKDSQKLVEAHLFEQLVFSGNIEKIVISFKDGVEDKPLNVRQLQDIRTNARSFAIKHGAQIRFE